MCSPVPLVRGIHPLISPPSTLERWQDYPGLCMFRLGAFFHPIKLFKSSDTSEVSSRFSLKDFRLATLLGYRFCVPLSALYSSDFCAPRQFVACESPPHYQPPITGGHSSCPAVPARPRPPQWPLRPGLFSKLDDNVTRSLDFPGPPCPDLAAAWKRIAFLPLSHQPPLHTSPDALGS